MIRRLSVAAVAVVLAVAGTCRAGDLSQDVATPTKINTSIPPDYVEHKITDVGTVKVPKEWTERAENPTNTRIMLMGKEGTNINVVVINTGADDTLANIMKLMPEQYPKLFQNFKMHESGYVKVGDRTAVWMAFEASSKGSAVLNFCQLFIIGEKNKGYILTYTATPDNYEKDLGTFKSALSSFKIDAAAAAR